MHNKLTIGSPVQKWIFPRKLFYSCNISGVLSVPKFVDSSLSDGSRAYLYIVYFTGICNKVIVKTYSKLWISE